MGFGNFTDYEDIPKINPTLNKLQIIQIACGYQFTVAITGVYNNFSVLLIIRFSLLFKNQPFVSFSQCIKIVFLNFLLNFRQYLWNNSISFICTKSFTFNNTLIDSHIIHLYKIVQNLNSNFHINFNKIINNIATLLDSFQVYSWGSNDYSKLGLGENREDEISIPQLIIKLNDKNIINISCGFFHTLALSSIFCCQYVFIYFLFYFVWFKKIVCVKWESRNVLLKLNEYFREWWSLFLGME